MRIRAKEESSMLTTLSARYSMYIAFVIKPSTTVLATIPARVKSASADTTSSHENLLFLGSPPFFDLPYHHPGVLSSFETLSRNPSCLGMYCAILPMKL